jgi:hypothetical protein
MDDQEKRSKLERLKHERESYVTRIFWIALGIAVIFAVPLVAAVLLIKFVTSGILSWVVIIVAFVSSWVIIAYL